MLCLKLSRQGKTKQPTFRLIVCEKTKDPWGSYFENLGYYNPRSKEANLVADRIKYWLQKGAKTTDTVWNLLVAKGIIEGKKKKISRISKKRLEKIKAKQKEDTKTEEQIEAATPSGPKI
jgi:small subunit ribosomal protein S16